MLDGTSDVGLKPRRFWRNLLNSNREGYGMDTKFSLPLRLVGSGFLSSAALLAAGCISTPAQVEPQVEPSAASVSQEPALLTGIELSVADGFRITVDGAEFSGQELFVRDGQPWEMRNLTFTQGNYKLTAEHGTFDPATKRFTMSGRARASAAPTGE